MKKIKEKLVQSDGTLNGKMLAGLIALAIVLVQQVLAAFDIKFPGDWNSIVAIINTLLTILGLIGVVSEVTPVSTSTDLSELNKQIESIEQTANEAHSTATSAAVNAISAQKVVSQVAETANTAKEQATQALKIADPDSYARSQGIKPLGEWIDKDGNIITNK